MGNIWNAALAGASLAAANHLTGNVVWAEIAKWMTYLGDHVAGQVSSLISWGAANTNAPLLSSAAANLSLGALWVYKWFKETKEHWIIRWVEKGTLWYSTPAFIMTALGMTSLAPWAIWAAATWLTLYGLRKTWDLGKTFMEKPGENILYGIKTPFRWTGKAYNFLKGKNS